MTQAAMAELYQGTKQNIFADGELDERRVVKQYLTTAADGKNYRTRFYNLEAILSVGYPEGTLRLAQSDMHNDTSVYSSMQSPILDET
jgi:hypothetical protein